MKKNQLNTWYYKKPDLIKKYFRNTQRVFHIRFIGALWFINLMIAIQFLILIPIVFVIDIIIELIIFIVYIVKKIIIYGIKLIFKLLFELFKALVKPFAILLSVAIFGILVYSLIRDVSVFETLTVIYRKIF